MGYMSDICRICMPYACGRGAMCPLCICGYAKILGLGLKVHVGPTCRIFIDHMSAIYVTYVIYCSGHRYIISIIHPYFDSVNKKIYKVLDRLAIRGYNI